MAEKKDMEKKKGVCYNDNRDLEEDCIQLLSLMKLNLCPKKKLVVLSIGGLLCHRVHRKGWSDGPIYRSPNAAYGSYKVYKRPYCTEFMKFCLERFEVGIWSSAKELYMVNALDCIFPGLRSKLVFFWDQNECTNSGFKTLENKYKPIFLKKLKKIYEMKEHSESDTLLIDTEPCKALLNPLHTAIFPAEYKATHVNDNALGPKGELRLYLDGLVEADSVPSYVKEHPFGKPAITPTHPEWEFYSKIISHNSNN